MVPVSMAHRIHVNGIFTYMKTIKINHSCRQQLPVFHGWYGWVGCHAKTFKATWPIDLGAIGSAARAVAEVEPRDPNPNAWCLRQGEWWERLVIYRYYRELFKWNQTILRGSSHNIFKLNVWCIVLGWSFHDPCFFEGNAWYLWK